MAKPRTNDAAIQYWADSILEDAPRDALEVNSIVVRNDVVFSFGSHYPMGVIQRDKRGRTVRVVLTTDHYPSRGFANTPGDQWNVKASAQAIASERQGIEIAYAPLSDFAISGIRCRPRPDDPEPPEHSYIEVPTYFQATDPGPEPVKDPHGCIAGRIEEYEAQEDHYVLCERELGAQDQAYALGRDIRPGDFLVRGSTGSTYARRLHLHRTEWGAAREAWGHYSGGNPPGTTYRQCPHCAAFDKLHEEWYVRMHGPRWGRGRGKGYERHAEMMARYGSEEAWREARREDYRRVRRERTERAAWAKRNFIPLSALSTKTDAYAGDEDSPRRLSRWRVPVLDADGYALRKDQEAYYLQRRKAERAERRRQRDHERQQREKRQIERFKQRVRRRRMPTFTARALEVAHEISEITEILSVNANAKRPSEESEGGE